MSSTKRFARTVAKAGIVQAQPLTATAAVAAGICTDTGQACANDAACPAGTCFVPPGGCVLDLGTGCDPHVGGSCRDGQFCQPVLEYPGGGTCRQIVGSCVSQADCPAATVCNDASQTFERLVAPLSERSTQGELFIGAGRCIENTGQGCVANGDCTSPEFCQDGACQRAHGTCKTSADCGQGALCRKDLLASGAADSDGDEIPDPFDNCPLIWNVLQEDTDKDGVGDYCDLQTCGDGVLQPGEICDDGNVVSGDGCDVNCTPTACGNGVVTAGEQCDDGNNAAGDCCSPDCQKVLADGSSCEDGVFCNGTDTCDAGLCVHLFPPCPSSDSCSFLCDEATRTCAATACDALIPGGGSPIRRECMAEWFTEPSPPPGRKGWPRNRLECRDGDASCDFGPSGDGMCDFQVALCLNADDPNLSCTPSDVREVRLLRPGIRASGLDASNRSALEDALRGIGARIQGICLGHTAGRSCGANADCDSAPAVGDGLCQNTAAFEPSLSTQRCTGLADIAVPLRNNGRRAGVRKLRLAAHPSGVGRADSDQLTLVCRPM
ncbi:MAG: hypothetical protein HY270_22540 [Deltaproteobacteria bacterium]|nr:hypothetical protein [Deltaproteobacteria bacterium]